MPFRHLLSDQSSLTPDDVLRLGELTAEWQLLADIDKALIRFRVVPRNN